MKNKNTPELWDKILFDKNKELLSSPYYIDKIESVNVFLKDKKGAFLDIGFGMGNLEKMISQSNSNIEVYGIDFSGKAVERAKKCLAGKYIVTNPEKLPFPESFFDYIAMLDVYEHMFKSDSAKVLREINRVIKSYGFFIISIPLNENLKKMNREGTNYNAHVREFSETTIAKELKNAGFKILKRKYIYAFKKLYKIKSAIIKLLPNYRKPNVLLIYSQKI